MKSGWEVLGIVILVVFSAVVVFPKLNSSCNENYRHDLTVLIDNKPIITELSKTLTERAKGLGDKKCIGSDQAMLFEFEKPGKYSFWMRDVEFPIDIIWLDAGRKVVKIEPNVTPETYPETFVNTQPALYVMELKSGQAKKLAIELNEAIAW